MKTLDLGGHAFPRFSSLLELLLLYMIIIILSITMGSASGMSTRVDPRQLTASSSRTAPFPALTTVFTPPQQCSTPFVGQYTSNFGYILPYQEYAASSVQCLPEIVTDSLKNIYGVSIYSPGLFCPLYYTTAAIDTTPGGVICCLSGLTYTSTGCYGSTQDGYGLLGLYTQSSGIANTVTGITTIGDSLFGFYADPITLLGQDDGFSSRPVTTDVGQPDISQVSSTSLTAVSTTLSSMGTPSTSPSTDAQASSPRHTAIAIGVGVGVAGLTLIATVALGAYLLNRYRRKRTQEAYVVSKDVEERSPSDVPQEVIVRGDADRSYGNDQMFELDPQMATAIELEHPVVQGRGELP
ncbi:hypothetical protein HD806DRAFT_504049 [Xylariaceae sp. AK1471]|nr:hypothetical protein HD806DRAFT_504049 [Xylariaceae sp. AK1471]